MAGMTAGGDEPATRRDLSNAREAIGSEVRADIAEVRTDMANGFRQTDQKIAAVDQKASDLRTEMTEGFRQTDQKIAAVDQKVSELRTEIAEGFRQTDQKIAQVRVDMADGFAKQTRFLVGLMVVMNGTLLATMLRLG